MKFILFFIILTLSILQGSTTVKIATYNVENLFDLKKSGYEYTEYIPYSKSQWNNKNYKIKLNNIANVIKDIDADIIALQEIESLKALKDLRIAIKQKGLYYRYFKIANAKNTTVKVALLSRYPFSSREIRVSSSYKYRNILEAKLNINDEDIYILVNHWKSKHGPESMRIESAKAIMKRVKKIGFDKNIVLLGDFNSHYEEYKTFKRKRKLNNTNGKTGINHILKTINYKDKAKYTDVKKGEFYNLWYDTDKQNRYSYKYRGKKEALDNILVSRAALKHYVDNSIHSFKAPYLINKRYIYRWQMTRKKPRVHKGKGYSDHLAVVAKFKYE
jgi:predicted extracellular nuclease